MLKLYTRKLKKAWEDTAAPITVNKREMILEFALCALTGWGILAYIICAP